MSLILNGSLGTEGMLEYPRGGSATERLGGGSRAGLTARVRRAGRALWVIPLLLTLLAGGCATNPVTGEKDFITVSQAQELAIGEQQYQPAQQSQGGKYVVDSDLT